jgi:hypothetical protein
MLAVLALLDREGAAREGRLEVTTVLTITSVARQLILRNRKKLLHRYRE